MGNMGKIKLTKKMEKIKNYNYTDEERMLINEVVFYYLIFLFIINFLFQTFIRYFYYSFYMLLII